MYQVLGLLFLAALSAAAPACPLNMCKMDCANGIKYDSNGCPTCECNPAPTCPLLMCKMDCTNGIKYDSNGCPTCECNDAPPCPILMCKMDCANGIKYDSNGCPTCECNAELVSLKSQACPLVMCNLDCEFGMKYDDNGCVTCGCNTVDDASDCQKKAAAAKKSPLIGAKVFACTETGEYQTLQTWENLNACVDSEGNVVTPWVQNPSLSCDCPLKAAAAKQGGLIGAFIPACDADTGFYREYQCSGSSGYCWCVNTATGEQQGDASPPGQFDKICHPIAQNLKSEAACPLVMCKMDCEFGVFYDSNKCPTCTCNTEDQATVCQKQYAASLKSGMVGAKVFTCDEQGNFNTVQTWENMHACVDSDGNVVSDWVKNDNLNCACSLDKASKQKTAAIGTFVPTCDSETGNYWPHQCSGSSGYCWCVDPISGKQFGESYPPGQFVETICHPFQSLAVSTCPLVMCKMDCEYGVFYDSNKCPTCTCNTKDQASACQKRYAIDSKTIPMGGKVFTCDEQGNYNKVQTWENMQACVDTDGNVLTDWIKNPDLECDCARKVAEAKATQQGRVGAYTPKCDAQTGRYTEIQCNGSTGYCWCVDTTNNQQYGDASPPGQLPLCHPF